MERPVRLIFVGRWIRGKVLRGYCTLSQSFKDEMWCTRLGWRRQKAKCRGLANTLGITHQVVFHGWQSRTSLVPLYARAHLIVLPSSSSEGWPKVLSEAMAFGVVPVASNVSSIPQYLQKFGVGKTCDPEDIKAFAEAIRWYSGSRSLEKEAKRGVDAADAFSYAHYLKAIGDLLNVQKADGRELLNTTRSNIEAGIL
ncbi:MAG: glycosyltransferase [Pyrinomonadaceae bacterium]